jgi:hypothetical protein
MTKSRNSIARCPLCGRQKDPKQLLYHLQIVHDKKEIDEDRLEFHSTDEISSQYRRVEQNE